jgi:hypothetical protein
MNSKKGIRTKYFCNGDEAVYPEATINAHGFLIDLLIVPVCWLSKGQSRVTLSSYEAVYVLILDATNKVEFICYLFKDIGIQVNLPIVVISNNMGALFISENA